MSPHRSLCIYLNLSVPTTLCECDTVTGVSLKKWPFGLFKYFNGLLIEKNNGLVVS